MNEVSMQTQAPVEEVDFMDLDKIIDDEFGNDPENLIMMLQSIQRRYNYLPRTALNYMSVKLGVPFSKIYGVATFYATFSLQPRGRNIVSICLGTACHVRGGERVHERIQEVLGICDGQTSADKRYTLESVRCIGCCSLGPVIKVNEEMHGRIGSEQVDEILSRYE